MRLIDADEVMQAVNELMIVDKTVMSFVLMNVPTVDAVPVVRCKDCIRFRPDDEVWGQCTAAAYGIRTTDFCSYGVRKDGGDEQTKKPE